MTKDNYDFIDVENRYTKKLSDKDKYTEEDYDFINDTGVKSILCRSSDEEQKKILGKLFDEKNNIVKYGTKSKDYAVELIMDDGTKHLLPLFSSKEQAEAFGVGHNVVFDYPFTTYEGEAKVYYLPILNDRIAREAKFFVDALNEVDSNPHFDWFDFEVQAKVTSKQKEDAELFSLKVGNITETVIASNRLKAEKAFEQYVDKVYNGKVLQILNVKKIRTVKPRKKEAA